MEIKTASDVIAKARVFGTTWELEEIMNDWCRSKIKQHLEIAADNAKTIQYQHDHGVEIDRESITEIKIEL